MKHHAPDTLYAEPQCDISNFVFDTAVADVFTDMINRSVPGYQTLLEVLGTITDRYARPNTYLYDLGCSLGAATWVLKQHAAPGCKVIAVDNAPAMVEKCRENLAKHQNKISTDIICSDAVEIPINNASLVVMNLTLQFIPPSQRLPLLTKAFSGILPGGAFFIAEKIKIPNAQQQTLFTHLHHAFKKANGYSELEVAQKRTALENVLIPETLETHISRLYDAGFSDVYPCFSCLNFAALLAVK